MLPTTSLGKLRSDLEVREVRFCKVSQKGTSTILPETSTELSSGGRESQRIPIGGRGWRSQGRGRIQLRASASKPAWKGWPCKALSNLIRGRGSSSRIWCRGFIETVVPKPVHQNDLECLLKI